MKLRLAALAASTGLATAVLAGAPAGAQDAPNLPLTVDPTSGTDGVFTVSGDSCINNETGVGVFNVFIDGEGLVNDDPENPNVANEDGTWSLVVEPFDPSIPLQPGTLEVTAECYVNDASGTVIATYGPATYEILPGEQPPAEEPPAEEPAPPAQPVVAQPTFTG